MTLGFRRFLFIMAEHIETEQVPVNPEVSYEHHDINIRLLVGGAIAILILALIGAGFSAFLLGSIENRQRTLEPTPLPLIQLRPTPPPPRLQPNIIDQETAAEDLATLQAQEEELLTTYGWVNREAGVVRIPIDQAIELMAIDSTPEPDQ
jgi:hypothetical protein